jgi:uncharacterized protein
MKARLIGAALVLSLVGAPAMAQPKPAAAAPKPAAAAAKRDAADEVVAALRYGQYYDAISKLAVAQVTERLQQHGLSGANLTAATTQIATDAAGYKRIFLSQLASSYRSRFTADELQEVKAFYSSPAGQKFASMKKPIDDDLAKATRDAGTFIGVSAAKFASSDTTAKP